MTTIIAVNGTDRNWTKHRYILAFGAYGLLRLMVWGNSLEDALDSSVDWIADNARGLLCDEAVDSAYLEARDRGLSEDEAWEEATVDTVCAGNSGHYLNGSEWTVVAEDPSRSEVLALVQGAV